MTPKDNELRMQIGLVITHTDDELLFVRSEKNPNILDALQAFADLVRADEREAVRILLADQARSYQQGNDFVSFLALSTLDMAIKQARGNHEQTR